MTTRFWAEWMPRMRETHVRGQLAPAVAFVGGADDIRYGNDVYDLAEDGEATERAFWDLKGQQCLVGAPPAGPARKPNGSGRTNRTRATPRGPTRQSTRPFPATAEFPTTDRARPLRRGVDDDWPRAVRRLD